MKLSPKDQQYILDNANKVPLSQIASHLGLKEKKVRTFLANYSARPQGPVLGAASAGPVPWKALSLIFLVSFLVYSNTFQSSFHFDDMKEIIQNPAIQQLPDLSPVWGRHKTRFLTYLSFALNHFFGKNAVFGYHLVNILIHTLAATALFFLARLIYKTPKMVSSRPIPADQVALFAALLFAVHPLQTQAVTYIVQRAASLAALFYYAAIYFYLRHRLWEKKGDLWLSVTAAAAAMFSKPIAVTLPIAILMMEAVFFGKESAKKNLTRLIPFVAAAALPAILVRVYGSAEFSGVADITKQTTDISRLDYALTQLSVLCTYLRLLFIPIGQNLDYDYPISRTFFEPAAMASFVLLVAIVYGAWRLLGKDRLATFGIFFFFVTLLPESSFYPLIDVIFEHRLYLPMAGFALFVAVGLSNFFQDGKKYVATLSVITLLFGGLAYTRNTVWKDEKTLWEDVIRKSPHKAGPYSALGMHYMQNGDAGKAMEYFERSIQEGQHARLPIATTTAGAYLNLGVLYGQKGDADKEIECYEKAIAADPMLADAYLNAGVAYGRKGDVAREIDLYQKAIERDPRSARAYSNLGAALIDGGRIDEAKQALQKALQLDPLYSDARRNLDVANTAKGV